MFCKIIIIDLIICSYLFDDMKIVNSRIEVIEHFTAFLLPPTNRIFTVYHCRLKILYHNKMSIYHLQLNQMSFHAVSTMTSHTLKTAFDLNNKREILFCSHRHKVKKFMRSQTHNSAHIFVITWAPVFCRLIRIVS